MYLPVVVLILAVLIAEGNFYFPCVTPNGEEAHCISLFNCPVLKKAVLSGDPAAEEFIKQSVCNLANVKDINVCCGTSADFHARPPSATTPKPKPSAPAPETLRDYVIRRILPSRIYCGLQHVDDRYYNSTDTALDEFPWLVHVKWYNLGDEVDFNERCNGFLITRRYVLTDWLCGWHATHVKLGQHATGQNFSCTENNADFAECTDGVEEVKVEEKFRYNIPSRSGSYNFVLLRLAKKVDYSDFIRPICLPLDEDVKRHAPTTLTFSGWGSSGPEAVAKKRLHYAVASEETCYKAHDYLEGNIKSAKAVLLCLTVAANNSREACNGDHGGPLMFSYSKKPQWFARGMLISVQEDTPSDFCSKSRPVTGLAITPEVIEWILSNMYD